MAHVRESQEEDLSVLASCLRTADCRELAAHRATPVDALRAGFDLSQPCLTVEHEGRAISMFGVTPFFGSTKEFRVGQIWLLGSDEIHNIRIQFLRESRHWLEEISESYDLICNVVHEDNELHHKWLKFLGFRFLNHQSPFIEFARIC